MKFLLLLIGVADLLRELHAEGGGDGGSGTDFFGALVRLFVVGGHADFDEVGLGFIEETVEVAMLCGFVVGFGGHG